MGPRLLVGVAHGGEIDEPRQDLLDLVDGLSRRGAEVQVLVFEDGPIRRALEAVVDVRLVGALAPRSLGGLVQSAARRVTSDLADRVHDLRTRSTLDWIRPPQSILVHGPRAVSVLRYVRARGVPVSTYVHPHDFSIAGLSPLDRERLVARTDRFLVVGEPATETLLHAGVDPARIDPIPRRSRFFRALGGLEPAAEVRARMGVPADAFLVVVPPVPNWSQSYDLTLAAAWELGRSKAMHPGVWWHWMSEPDSKEWPWELRYDVARMGLATVNLAVDGPGSDELLAVADAVFLPDGGLGPQTAALVEQAATEEIPVLGWSSNPLASQVASGGGVTVPPPDVETMAARIMELVHARSGRPRSQGRPIISLPEPNS